MFDQGLCYYDLGAEKRNCLTGWVDSDFASDMDTRKSMTCYLMSLNGGPFSWKSSRQGGVTLSSSEAEFVAASQAGQEAIYFRALLKGFGYCQTKPTEIWEDKCFEMCRHVTTCQSNARRHAHRCARCRALGAGQRQSTDNTRGTTTNEAKSNPAPERPGCLCATKYNLKYQLLFRTHFVSTTICSTCWVIVPPP